ncbi:MAG: CAP domain-containing protein [Saprospiraceae bacterium]
MKMFILSLIGIIVLSISIQAQPLHNQEHIDLLKSIEKLKSTPNKSQLTQIRQAMLKLNNEGRLNPNYRKSAGCKTALTISPNLTALVLDKRLNDMAQEQAVYQASVQRVTHDNSNYGNDYGKRARTYVLRGGVFEACAGDPLSNSPMGWMKSETHYRPTWNLDGETVNSVGFGAAVGADGKWYVTAVWANMTENTAPTTSTNTNEPSTTTASNTFEEGETIEVRHNGKWYEGTYIMNNSRYTAPHKVRFQVELTVYTSHFSDEDIRKSTKKNKKPKSNTTNSKIFKVGETVKVQYNGNWYEGTYAADYSRFYPMTPHYVNYQFQSNTYTSFFSDEDIKKSTKKNKKPKSDTANSKGKTFTIGEKVKVQHNGNWYEGIYTADHSSFYSTTPHYVKFQDGLYTYNNYFSNENIKKSTGKNKTPKSNKEPNSNTTNSKEPNSNTTNSKEPNSNTTNSKGRTFEVGEKIKVRLDGKWYEGTYSMDLGMQETPHSVKIGYASTKVSNEDIRKYTAKPRKFIKITRRPESSTINATQLEDEIIREINVMRVNPKKYAKKMTRLKENYIKINEGWYLNMLEAGLISIGNDAKKAEHELYLNELIAELKKSKKLSKLDKNTKLMNCARILATDKDARGHTDSRGGGPQDRARTAGYNGGVSECVFVGTTAFFVVGGYLIDAGVESRGHRKNLMSSSAKEIGVSCYDFGGGHTLKNVINMSSGER